MNRWVIDIPDFLPTRLNLLLRWHWARRYRVLKADAEVVGIHVRLARVPPATGKRRLSVRFESPRTLADEDAREKVLWDALVRCGALVDDSPAYLVRGTVESVRGPSRRTVIVLEDVEG